MLVQTQQYKIHQYIVQACTVHLRLLRVKPLQDRAHMNPSNSGKGPPRIWYKFPQTRCSQVDMARTAVSDSKIQGLVQTVAVLSAGLVMEVLPSTVSSRWSKTAMWTRHVGLMKSMTINASARLPACVEFHFAFIVEYLRFLCWRCMKSEPSFVSEPGWLLLKLLPKSLYQCNKATIW